EVFDLGEAVGGTPGAAEEELEQELTACGRGPSGHGEPPRELLPPLRRERVDVPIRLPALRLPPPLCEALGGEPLQDRVDLPVALVPEVRDGALDELLDVVAGHRAEAQHPKDRVPARVRPARRHGPAHPVTALAATRSPDSRRSRPGPARPCRSERW